MKTISPILSAAAMTLGVLCTAAFAGPSPQFWNKPPSTGSTSRSAVAAKCPDCTDRTKWAVGNGGPAGKGVSGASVAGKTHQCGACTGAIAHRNGKVNDSMVRGEKCASAQCCR